MCYYAKESTFGLAVLETDMPEKLRDGGLALFCALAFAVVGYVAIAYPLTHNLEQLRLGGGWDANLISFSMVFTKFFPNSAYTHEVRMMMESGFSVIACRSPSSLEAPYTLCGLVGESVL